MKLKLLMLLFTIISTAQQQINLSGITQNMSIGQDCSSSQTPEQYRTTGDMNLNGKTVQLRNTYLEVTGNLNGSGSIAFCGNSSLCVRGVIQNNPNIESGLLNCSTLSVVEFDFRRDFDYNFEIYNLAGQKIKQGKTSINMLEDLPKNQVFIVRVENFKPFKVSL